jgi:hypothetical protein
MLRKSPCPIEKITLDDQPLGVPGEEIDIGHLLKNLPSLRYLNTPGFQMKSTTINMMRRNECATSLQRLDCVVELSDLDEFTTLLHATACVNGLARPDK